MRNLANDAKIRSSAKKSTSTLVHQVRISFYFGHVVESKEVHEHTFAVQILHNTLASGTGVK